MNIEALQAYMNEPPEAAKHVCFMYRQAIGARQQAERHLVEAREAVARAGAHLNKAIGVEAGLHSAVVALANPTEIPDNLHHLSEDPSSGGE